MLDPRTVDLTVRSEPPFLPLRIGGVVTAAPFTRTVVVGSPTTVGAPSPQSLGGRDHDFVTWSNGGTSTHTIIPTATRTLTATYAPRNRPPVARARPV